MNRRLFSSAALSLLAFAGKAPAAAAEPQLTVTSPTNGAVITGTSLTINFRVTDFTIVPTNVPVAEAGMRPEVNREGEGHLHFVLDLQPLVVWERTTPYTFTDVPPGEHELHVELVQNDHGPLPSPVSQRIRFRTTALLSTAGAGTGPETRPWAIVLGGAVVAAVGGGLLWRRRTPAGST